MVTSSSVPLGKRGRVGIQCINTYRLLDGRTPLLINQPVEKDGKRMSIVEEYWSWGPEKREDMSILHLWFLKFLFYLFEGSLYVVQARQTTKNVTRKLPSLGKKMKKTKRHEKLPWPFSPFHPWDADPRNCCKVSWPWCRLGFPTRSSSPPPGFRSCPRSWWAGGSSGRREQSIPDVKSIGDSTADTTRREFDSLWEMF